MSTQPVTHSDPLIDEVRQRRKDLFAACGNNLDKLFEAIQRQQAQHPEKLIDQRDKVRPRIKNDDQ